MSQASGTLLVTGASAFLGVHVVNEALNRGLTVVGTVRSKEKGEYLVRLFKGKPFSYVIVEDVEKENGFDEAVRNVDYIAHIASPFHFRAKDPQRELVEPAVNGTLSVLRAAHKNGQKVKAIVITSSNAALYHPHKPPYVFTAKDWNTYSVDSLKEKGANVSPIDGYRASKTLAERAAWDFMDKDKPTFQLSTVCPPLILGPILHQVTDPASLNTSIAQAYAYLKGDKKGEDAQGSAGMCADVRDCAYVHVESLLRKEAGGHRFPTSTCPYSWQDVLDVVDGSKTGVIKEVFTKTPRGTPGSGKGLVANSISQDDTIQILGLKYTAFEKTVEDMAVSLAEREKSGWTSLA